MRFYLSLLLLVSSLVGLDQATKVWATKIVKHEKTLTVVPGFFSLTNVHNPGVAFGLGAKLTSFFTIVSFIAIAFILYLLIKTDRKELTRRVGLGFLLAGAVGNLIDRVKDGYVTDFLDFEIGGFHWPAFNMADVAVCIGVGLFIWKIFNDEQTKPSPASPDPFVNNSATIDGQERMP